jgi:SAM-dependent methyltransferase
MVRALSGMERMRSSKVSPDSHHYIVVSLLNDWLKTVAAPAATGVLLDLGCGGQPYRHVFQPYITRYVGADVATAAGVTLDLELTPGAPAPLPDASVDTVLSTQVLEHVFDFRGYLADCARLLRPGGRLILSVPMHWRHHEVPYDYWRFTRYGLTESVKQAGFAILDLRPCGGFYALLGQAFLDHRNAKGKTRRLVSIAIARLALWCDRRAMDADDTLGWMCIAEKSGVNSENCDAGLTDTCIDTTRLKTEGRDAGVCP